METDYAKSSVQEDLVHVPIIGPWYPMLSNSKKKLPYSEKALFLVVHAATRLHYWVMDAENSSYSALESSAGLFQSYYYNKIYNDCLRIYRAVGP